MQREFFGTDTDAETKHLLETKERLQLELHAVNAALHKKQNPKDQIKISLGDTPHQEVFFTCFDVEGTGHEEAFGIEVQKQRGTPGYMGAFTEKHTYFIDFDRLLYGVNRYRNRAKQWVMR